MTEQTPVEPIPVIVVQEKKKFWTPKKEFLVGTVIALAATAAIAAFREQKNLKFRSETNQPEPSTGGATSQS